MLSKHLIAKTNPYALQQNIVCWKDYRITVLADRLFRIEKSENKQFRDDATQSVWFRNVNKQEFTFTENGDSAVITTPRCSLVLCKNREDCRIVLNGKSLKIDNSANLKGTYRTLDQCNGSLFHGNMYNANKEKFYYDIEFEEGVCSKNGVAVINDSNSLTLGQDGEIKPEIACGSDEYVFAYGNDYRGAIKALYEITGKTPLVPRFALGNWWSRYHVYTQDEYLKLLQRFEDRDVPLTVATIDMDWHYSTKMEEDLHITELGRNTEYYGGNNGWTGYSWNKRLFPDHKAMLKEIKRKNLKITLNLHPADGIRWWEDHYADMANAIGVDPKTMQKIPFDIADTNFINAYFECLHKPLEREGVDFWWVDWQQGTNSKLKGLDPLWALNHYHTLDNGKESSTPLLLSRYCGVGTHRYPLGFSGDTFTTWKTLKYLPYFTLTASNVGYSWWSHDIGGHYNGEKNDELYVRHLQYGVFSPIMRLHCSNAETATKEPWAYKNGAGKIAEDFMRFRHKLIPYLYTESINTHERGSTLVEPLYYEWNNKNAHKYKTQYLFGSQLMVSPVVTKRLSDGYARTKVWLPKGIWTDIFTGDKYYAGENGREVTMLRTLDSIPVLIREGGILPTSADSGNVCDNPQKLHVSVWNGNGNFTLREDGNVLGNTNAYNTEFTTEYCENGNKCTQKLKIAGNGDYGVIPQNRVIRINFKDIAPEVKAVVYKNGKALETANLYQDFCACEFVYENSCEYLIEVTFEKQSEVQLVIDRALKVLLTIEGSANEKHVLFKNIKNITTINEYESLVSACKLSSGAKLRLLETL